MKTLSQPRLLHILLLVQVWVVSSLACNPNQYLKDMKCCDKCPPGQKLVSTCAAESDTQCEDCANGEYQDTWNTEKNCQPFSYCDPNAGFLQRSAGTAAMDAVCECVPGRHCSSVQCETCIVHTPCAPGFGVVIVASKLFDTKCEPCQSGTFSNESSLTERCHSWSSCDVNQEVKKMGSPSSDVKCGPKAGASMLILKVLLSVGIIAIFILGVVLYCLRDKVPCLRNVNCGKKAQVVNPKEQTLEPQELEVLKMPKEEQVIPEDTPPQTAVEEDEALISLGSPIQESAGIQEVGKDSHLSQQEMV